MASLYNRDFAPSVVLWTANPEFFWKGTTKRGKGNTSEVGSPLKMKPCYLSQHVCKHTLSSWGCDNIQDLSWLCDGVLPNQTHYCEKCLNWTGWCWPDQEDYFRGVGWVQEGAQLETWNLCKSGISVPEWNFAKTNNHEHLNIDKGRQPLWSHI